MVIIEYIRKIGENKIRDKIILKEIIKKGILFSISLGFLSVLVLIHIRLHEYAFDDAFIHFRVARNWVENGYPYFNLNEMVKVSTSTGWIAIMAFLYLMRNIFMEDIPFPFLISIFNAIVLFMCLIVYTKVVETVLKKRLSIYRKIIFQSVFLGLLLPTSLGLMEIPFALFIAGIGIFLLLNNRYLGFTLLGIAVYIRLELLVLLFMTILLIYYKKELKFFQIIGLSLSGVLLFGSVDMYFFHTIVPQSIIAKSQVYSLSSLQTLFFIFLSIPSNNIYYISSISFLSTVILTGWASIREKGESNNIWAISFFLWSLGIMFSYIVGKALIFDWYKPLYTVPLFVACFLYSHLIEKPRNIPIKITMLSIFFIVLITTVNIYYAGFINIGKYINFESGSRVRKYIEIGKILNEENPTLTLLTSEIGGLGYSFKGRVIDAAGLASPEALDFHPMKVPEQRMKSCIGAIPPEFVKTTMPEIIVSFDTFAQALLEDEIIDQYNIIKLSPYLPNDEEYSEDKILWGNGYLRIYILKTLPISDMIERNFPENYPKR